MVLGVATAEWVRKRVRGDEDMEGTGQSIGGHGEDLGFFLRVRWEPEGSEQRIIPRPKSSCAPPGGCGGNSLWGEGEVGN